ncbi:hypothetical protein DYB25_001412 [Aphanomyces astaci]|uniref:HTH myb-type domain-containing protein n=1 Tax=Aphanomyces astaci TaxID=112090 RepID=A0A397B663_APHAT|nr:hypothetical protein DYB25_001412 [Aphanomyces astaci]
MQQGDSVSMRRLPETKAVEMTNDNNISASSARGPWAQDEVHRLTQALSMFPDGQYLDMAKYIGTRSPQQVQMYVQKHRDALSKRQVGHRRRRSWEEGQPHHVVPSGSTPSSSASQPSSHRQRQPVHPTYLHPPPSLARPTLPSPRLATPRNSRSLASMGDSVLIQFPGTSYREKLLNFYYKFNPSKVHEVDHILDLFRNRELRLFLNLSLKYQLSESMPAELITQRLRSIQRTPTLTSEDSNLRLLSTVVPPPQPFHDTRPFLPSPMALRHGNGSLPTLRPPLISLTPTGRTPSSSPWSNTPSYHI